jgi:Erv1 / Alr family
MATASKADMIDPRVTGPLIWFSLHNAANYYPVAPSALEKAQMIGILKGLPMLMTCSECRMHTQMYMNTYSSRMGNICSTRATLFEFLVNFHNEVNLRQNKQRITLEQAYRIYNPAY